MSDRFADILTESRRIQEELKKAGKKEDVVKVRGLSLMPQCITMPLSDYFGKKISYEELRVRFEEAVPFIGKNREKLTDLFRQAGSGKESRADLLNNKKKLAGAIMNSSGEECGNTACPHRRKCPVANLSKISAMLDILALKSRSFTGKAEFEKTLLLSPPSCFKYYIPAASVAVLEGRFTNDDGSADELLQILFRGEDAPKGRFYQIVRGEIASRQAENPDFLIAALREKGFYGEEIATMGTDPMHYKHADIPGNIWNGDRRTESLIFTYVENNGAIAAEPYRYTDKAGKKNYGLMLWVDKKLFIPDDKVIFLAPVLQRHLLITSYATPLVTFLRLPRQGHIFKSYEKNTNLHARLKLRTDSIVSVTRMVGGQKKSDTILTHLLSCLIKDITGIDGSGISSVYDLMQFYVPFYKRNKNLTETEEYKNGILFDRLAGASAFLPGQAFMAGRPAFALDLENVYDFEVSIPEIKDGAVVPKDKFEGCAYYYIREKAGGGICDSVIRNIVEKDHITRFDTHLMYYGTVDGSRIAGFISPASVYNMALDLIIQSASRSGTEGSYDIFSDFF